MIVPCKAIALAFGAAVLAVGASVSAQAMEPDILTRLNDGQFVHPGQFYLYGRADQKAVDLAKKQDVKVCVREQRDVLDEPRSVAMKIKAAGKTEIIRPGHCLVVDAKNIDLKADGAVPQNWEIAGQITHQG
jgi:hypothetical protein